MSQIIYNNKCVRVFLFNGKHECQIANDYTPFLRYEGLLNCFSHGYIQDAKVIIEDEKLFITGTEIQVDHTGYDYHKWIYPNYASKSYVADPTFQFQPKFLYNGVPLENYYNLEGLDLLFDPSVTKMSYRYWYHFFIGKKTRRFVSYFGLRRKATAPFQLICTNWSLTNADGQNVI